MIKRSVRFRAPYPAADRADQLRYHLGARIRVLRDARGLTQEKFADRIEVTPKYVSQLECGQRSPSWETLTAIAHDGFTIKLATLMFGIESGSQKVLDRLRKDQTLEQVEVARAGR